ncbi:MAG: hypothetical protein F6K36_29725 [Symploca sp. SIO3C6]|nr:hypothetical protein [Symploca sp. SIO3C6]
MPPPAPLTSSDPRVGELARALAYQQSITRPSSPSGTLTQQQLTDVLAHSQDRAVGYFRDGISTAASIQSGTVAAMGKVRPHVTTNDNRQDHRAYNAYEYLEANLSRQSAPVLAAIALLLAVLLGCGSFALANYLNNSQTRPASSTIRYH